MHYLRSFAPYDLFYETTPWDYFLGIVCMSFIMLVFTGIRYFFSGTSEENGLIASQSNQVVSPFLIHENNEGRLGVNGYKTSTKVFAALIIILLLATPMTYLMNPSDGLDWHYVLNWRFFH